MENYSFGKLVAGFRGIYDLSQDDLADILLCTRTTINTVEKAADVSDLTNDSLFRLHYLFSLYSNREDETWYQEHLLKCVEGEINNRINNSTKGSKVKSKKLKK